MINKIYEIKDVPLLTGLNNPHEVSVKMSYAINDVHLLILNKNTFHFRTLYQSRFECLDMFRSINHVENNRSLP